MRSVVCYLDGNQTLTLLCRQTLRNDTGFSKNIKAKIFGQWSVSGVLIHSTFKTIKQKLEMFLTVVPCMSAEFSLAYFLIEGGMGNNLKSKQESSTFLVHHLKSTCINLESFFLEPKKSLTLNKYKMFSKYSHPYGCGI